MHELNQRLVGVAVAWIVLTPVWLLSLILLVWGRASLPPVAVKKGLLWTAAASAMAVPVAWAVFTMCARFNPRPVLGPIRQGLWWAVMFLPAYSALLGCGAFEVVLQDALKSGAPPRSRFVRRLSELTLTLVVMGAVAILVAGCFLAAGPKAMG